MIQDVVTRSIWDTESNADILHRRRHQTPGQTDPPQAAIADDNR